MNYFYALFRFFNMPGPPKLFITPNEVKSTLAPEYISSFQGDEQLSEEELEGEALLCSESPIVIEGIPESERLFKER